MDNTKVTQQTNAPRCLALTDYEKSVLDAVLDKHGKTPTWTLVRQTHSYKEYREVYVEGISTRIPYETLLKYYGSAEQFRYNRPVVSKQMAAQMKSPFLHPEPDL